MKTTDRLVQFLKGAGPRKAEALGRLGIRTLSDLLTHYPRRHVDRSQLTFVRDLAAGQSATSLVEVVEVSVQPTRHGRQNFHAHLRDETGSIKAIWFNQAYLRNYFKRGTRLMVSGEIERFGVLQFKNPEYELVTDEERELIHTGRIVPTYPLTAGISQRSLRALVRQALDLCREDLVEHLPEAMLQRRDLVGWSAAVESIHFPPSWVAKEKARRRIVYDDFFVYQLLTIRRREISASLPGIAFKAEGFLSRQVARSLPFELTHAQKKALLEIRDEMRLPRPMNRLLEGEVGSGKTLVALLASCLAIEEGYQVAFLAPTEILAEQHLASLTAFLGDETVRVRLLTGHTGAAERREVLEAAAAGESGIFAGTHALIQESVSFGNLGLVVVDEQHRFGVRQRADLVAKGRHPDVLVMTATPIPRTLAKVFFGDLTLSVIDELPKGRGKVRTRVAEEKNRERVYDFIRQELVKGHRAFVVYPIIEESEKVDLRAAAEMAENLRAHPVFRGFQVGLLHGKMKGDEKSEVMQDFRDGRCQLLVTTTVIEVGVDVPEATVMLVEHPDRYGLSQLHQLRGRIGRGSEAATFILLAGKDLGRETIKRLRVLETTTSGFEVAEKDLEIRGPGEVFGTRQHGEVPELSLARMGEDREVIQAAIEDAEALLGKDPELSEPACERLRERLIARYGGRAAFYHVG